MDKHGSRNTKLNTTTGLSDPQVPATGKDCSDTVILRFGMPPRLQRDFEVFGGARFLVALLRTLVVLQVPKQRAEDVLRDFLESPGNCPVCEFRSSLHGRTFPIGGFIVVLEANDPENLPMKKVLISSLSALLILMLTVALGSESSWVGQWEGLATTAREETSIAIRIERMEGRLAGSLTLGDVGVSGYPIASIEEDAGRLRIAIPSDSGMQRIELEPGDDRLEGTWIEPEKDEIAFLRLTKAGEEDRVLEQKVRIDGPAGKIGASLFLPPQPGPVPAIVFLHGSGRQSRDANRFAAERFAKMGITAIIYDKRGVGETEGNFEEATFAHLAADAIAVAEYLRGHAEVSIIGFAGHSQGGWVATLAASIWKPAGFVITSSGPAVAPSREAQWTVVRAMGQQGSSESEIEQARRVIEAWHDGVRSGEWDRFDTLYAAAKGASWFEGSLLEAFGEKPGEMFGRYYRGFMDYDPLPAIKALQVPFLAILSPDDESIDARETLGILEGLEKPNISLRLYPGYGHALRRLGDEGQRLRWPEHPEGYFRAQADFIEQVEP